jgi:3',5'-nucleoside bisphosphate phosphatase
MTRKIQPLLCELHAHTTWSDGVLGVRQLADLYGRNGFDVLCITDHILRREDPWKEGARLSTENHATYLDEIEHEATRALRRYGLLVVPGLELTYNDSDPFLSAHAVAVGCRTFIPVDDGIEFAMAMARREGAAVIAAHPYRARSAGARQRATLRFAREWRTLAGCADRWELFNRFELYGWVAQRGLPVVASGDFHHHEHLAGWKTLLPCMRDENAVVGYLRSPRPAFLARVEPPATTLAA